MPKIINLYHFEEEDGGPEVQYETLCDGVVEDKYDVGVMAGIIGHEVKLGRKPIVGVFLPKGEIEMADRVVDKETGEIKENLALTPMPKDFDSSQGIAIVELEKNAVVQANIQKVADIETWANAFQVKSEDDVKAATNDISLIVRIKAEVEAERKKIADPPRLYLEHINSTFKSLLSGPLDRAQQTYNSKIVSFHRKVKDDAKRIGDQNELAVRQALAQANATGQPVVLPPLAQQPAQPPARVRAPLATGFTKTRRKWRWAIGSDGKPVSYTEIMEKLPDCWKCVDTKKMDDEVAKNDRLTEADFNGLVEFFDEDTYQTKRKAVK